MQKKETKPKINSEYASEESKDDKTSKQKLKVESKEVKKIVPPTTNPKVIAKPANAVYKPLDIGEFDDPIQ